MFVSWEITISYLKWEGEIIGMQHLRIVPGRNIAIGKNALTSSFMDDVYEAGIPGKFQFSSVELGANSTLTFPRPMGMDFTVGYLVSMQQRMSPNIYIPNIQTLCQSTIMTTCIQAICSLSN